MKADHGADSPLGESPISKLTRGVLEDTSEALHAELAALDAKLVEYQAAVQRRDDIRRVLEGINRLLTQSSTAQSGEKAVWEGAREILAHRQEPMTAKEITDDLTSLGWEIGGKTPVEAVRTALIRKGDLFERVDGGKFRLRDGTTE